MSADERLLAQASVEQQALLAEVFVLVSDTLVADHDVSEVLDRLARACVDLLGASAAALMLTHADGSLGVAAASDQRSQALELFQIQRDEGPCMDCVRTGAAVLGVDLATQADRWPRFVPQALALGFRSVNSLPLRLRAETVGALNVFHRSTEPFGAADARIAQALADAATIGILQHQAVSRSAVVAEQLQHALESRVVIEQAKGMLAQHMGVGVDVAFAHLRHYCRNGNLKLGETAQRLVERALAPSAVAAKGPGRR